MQGTQRSEIRLCESEKIKTLRGTNWCKNITGLKAGDNVVPPGFDQIFEGDTLFPHEEEELQGNQRSEIRLCESEKLKKSRGTNWYKNIAGLKVGENVAPPSFDQIFESDTLFPHEEEEMQGTQRSERPCESEKVKKVRGTNMCKKVGGLKVRETLHVTFYHNRVVGQHHASFTRHLGILVCDHNMCPLHVHSWADIEKYKLQYTWEAVTDKFDSDDINNQLDHVLKHMRKLWNN
nr:uncharacterized protein LOC108944123 isoform X4 [Nicotiana tomentosiformis]